MTNTDDEGAEDRLLDQVASERDYQDFSGLRQAPLPRPAPNLWYAHLSKLAFVTDYERAATREAPSLSEIIEPLSDVLSVHHLGSAPDTGVQGIEILDEGSSSSLFGKIVLAIGVEMGGAAADRAIQAVSRAGAAAVVFAPPSGQELDSRVPSSSVGTGGIPHSVEEKLARGAGKVAVLQRSRWVSWGELFTVLRRDLYNRASTDSREAAGYRSLSHLANTVATLTGAAITIEDPDSRVVAFSVVSETVDSLRKETILGQQVPQWRIEELRQSGFLRTLWASTDVIHRPAQGERPARLVVAVRGDDEIFGSIWAAEAGTPFSESTYQALRLASQAAVPLFVDRGLREGVRERAKHSAVLAVLSGDGATVDSARLLGLPIEGSYRVLACKFFSSQLDRRFDALILRILAHFPGTVCAEIEEILFFLISGSAATQDRERNLLDHLKSLVLGLAPGEERLCLALGRAVGHLGEVSVSTQDAQLVLRALADRHSNNFGCTVIANREDLEDEVNIQRLLEVVAQDPSPFTRRIRVLMAYDCEHESTLTRTLSTYLETHGSIAETARRMHLHSNSLRYRLRRISELSGMDLSDPTVRIVVELGLRHLRRLSGTDCSEALRLQEENRPV